MIWVLKDAKIDPKEIFDLQMLVFTQTKTYKDFVAPIAQSCTIIASALTVKTGTTPPVALPCVLLSKFLSALDPYVRNLTAFEEWDINL